MINYTAIPVNHFGENCVIVWNDNNEGFLADPGGSFPVIKKTVEAKNIKIKAILITHGHLDHIGAVHTCATYFNAPILGPEKNDQFLLSNIHQQSQMLGLPEIDNLEPTRYLTDQEKLEIASMEILTLHTPGHTPGHVVYYLKQANLCITGDLIFLESVGRTDFPRGSLDDLQKSIKEKIFTLPIDTILQPGHGPATTVGDEQMYNPYVGGF